MKILHYIFADFVSGLESVAANILKELSSENEVYYAAPDGPGFKTVKKKGVNTVACKTTDKKDMLRVYNKIKPDVVHAHDPRVSFVCATAGIPFISHLHCNCDWLGKLCPNSIALLFVCLKADKIICVSQSIIDEYIFKAAMRKKAVVLPNYVDREDVLEKASFAEELKYDLCYIGRMRCEKRPTAFVDVIKELKKKKPDVKAVMAGTGVMFDEVKEYVASNKLEDTIAVLGHVENPYKIIAESKIGVLTSSSEGFGLVAVEAMILSKPFLSFNVGGLPMIINNKNGKLCITQDEMVEEAYNLLTNKDLYERKSNAAAKTSYKFTDKEAYINSIKKIYKEHIDKHYK